MQDLKTLDIQRLIKAGVQLVSDLILYDVSIIDYDDAFQIITTYLDTIEYQLLGALNEKNYEKTYYSLFFIKQPLHRNYILTIFA